MRLPMFEHVAPKTARSNPNRDPCSEPLSVHGLAFLVLSAIALTGACGRAPGRSAAADSVAHGGPPTSSDSAQAAYRDLVSPGHASADSTQPRRDELIEGGPRTWFGQPRTRIIAAFGPPDRINAHPDTSGSNAGYSDKVDSLVTFDYNGATFVFYTLDGFHDDELIAVTIWDARFLQLSPIQLGSTVREVRSYFGDDAQGSTSRMRYSSSGGIVDQLELWFESDRLVRLEWTYGLD